MKPKEKAEDLVNKFIPQTRLTDRFDWVEAKRYALICVDEIIRTIPMTYYDYWKEVKQQINKTL